MLSGILSLLFPFLLSAEQDKAIHASISSDSSKIYLTVSFKDQDESRLESPWIWDQKTSSYQISSLKEDSLTIIIETLSEKNSSYDVWIWRAALTDPSGRAIDAYAPNSSSGIISGIRPDSGELPWTLSCPSSYSGELVPRFRTRSPSGSLADVMASSEWKYGLWTVKFARDLKSSDQNDANFAHGKGFKFYLFKGTESFFDLKNATEYSYRLPISQGDGK